MKELQLSKRIQATPPSPIRKLAPFAERAVANGKKVYHLNIGQPDIETPAVALEAMHNFKEKIVAYSPSPGYLEFRQNMAKYYLGYNLDVSAENIVVTTGGSEAILYALMATLDSGDEVLIPEPCYTNYFGYNHMIEAKIIPIPTQAEDGFALPGRATIEALITPRTKTIIICNPNNPTGRVMTEQEITLVRDLALAHNLFVISDEVYREFTYDGIKHISILEYPELNDRAILVDSVSKRFSLCGARVGFLVSRNAELIRQVTKLAQARLSPPTMGQYLGNAALKLTKDYYQGVTAEYQTRRDVMFEALSRMEGVFCVKPRGAFYMVVNLPVKDTEHFAQWLLEDFDVDGETIMAAPAQGFYVTEGLGLDKIRLAYVLNCDRLRRAMDILEIGLQKYRAAQKA